MLQRPIFSYIEIGRISAVTSWIIFLSPSFSRLFTDAPSVVPKLSPSHRGWCLFCFKHECLNLQRATMKWNWKKKRECISVVAWYVIGGGIQTETAREPCLKAHNDNLCKATTSGQNGCDRKAAMKAGSRASELRLSWWRSRAPPLWWTLSPCGAAHFRNDLLHPC